MSCNASEQVYDGAMTLARSLFGFALVAWLPLLISWILLCLSPASPDETYEQLRRAAIGGGGIVTAIAFILMLRIYRLDTADSERIASRFAKPFGNHWLSLVLILVLVEANILAVVVLRDIAPSITNPARFLFFCWTLVFVGLQLTIHWRVVSASFLRHGKILALACLLISAFAVVAVLFIFSSRLVMLSGIPGRLRGALDYRRLAFIDDGSAPSAQQFWAEQGGTRVRWLPYSYWTVEPIAGDFINVGSNGLRRTLTVADDENARRIYFFGGSTMWGEGARDEYTIPSQVAILLADSGLPAVTRNYAQTGYVSTQDLIMFQSQLALGNVPDLAVFYHGFNDVFSAWLQGLVGIPLRESQRVSDVEAGRLLRGGQPVLRLPAADLSQYDWSLVAARGASAEAIADRWLASRRLIRAAAAEYGVSVLFVWQPAIIAKLNPTATEIVIMSELEQRLPDFVELYRDVDTLLREMASREQWDDLVFRTELFRDHEGDIFFDRVHINEYGNAIVAQSLLEPLQAALRSR